MSKDGSVRVTFKMDEEDLKVYVNSKSSPSAYLKDLVRADMQKSNQVQNTNITQEIPNNMFDFID